MFYVIGGNNMAYTICIANQKGGVGKTTSTIEIAAALTRQGKRVLVIDFDQQRNLSKYVGADLNMPSIYQVLNGDYSVQDATQKIEDGFSIICASDELSLADKKFTDPTEDIFLLADVIEIVKDEYDYVLVDNSPSRNILIQMAYVAADGIIMPTESDIGSIDGIYAIYSDVEKFKKNRNKLSHAEFLGFILNKYERTNIYSLAIDNLETARERINPNAFILTVRKASVASEAKTMMQSIQTYKRSSTTAIDYRAVAEEVIKRVEGEE
jgi:chromosome partitioning protein